MDNKAQSYLRILRKETSKIIFVIVLTILT
jgi:hypothetical protein